MIEIELPCCDHPAVIERDADEIRCEACGLAHELASDAREPRRSRTEIALAA
jgi:hypothetical protein